MGSSNYTRTSYLMALFTERYTNSFGGKESTVSATSESPRSRRHVMADKEPVAEAAAATKADESTGRIRKSPSEKNSSFLR